MNYLIYIEVAVYIIMALCIVVIFEIEKIFMYTKVKIFRRVKKESKTTKELRKMLEVVFDTEYKGSPYLFYILTIIIFVITIILVARYSLWLGIFTSIIFSSIPFLYTITMLRFKRVKASNEAENVVLVLKTQYHLNYKNILETLDQTVKELENSKNCKILMERMARRLKECTNKERKDAINDFVYGIDTNWAYMLGYNILLALEMKVDITMALDDLIDEFKLSVVDREKEEKLNNEALLVAKVFNPIIYPIEILIANRFFDFTPNKFLMYQTQTEIGINLLLIIVTFTIINIFIKAYFRNRKFDF